MTISVHPVPREFTYLFCAKEYGWTPSQVDAQDVKKLNGLIQVSTIVNSMSASMQSRAKQQQSNNMPKDIFQ
jgi:hypothetical protein